jgi:hypothetical protein
MADWLIDWLISIWVRAVTVPMHGDLINGPFVPHNLISAQWSPVLAKLPDDPPDLTFNDLWVQEKEPRYAFSFTLKVPVNELPPNSPAGPVYKAFILHISQIPHKISLNNFFFPFLKGPRKGTSLHVPHKWGPYGNRRPFPEPYLAYPSMFMEYRIIFLPWHNSPQWARASSLSRIHDQTQTHHYRQDSSGWMINPTQRPLHDKTHNTHKTDIHVTGGIRTCNSSKLAPADPHFRPRDHRDRLLHDI